MNAWYVNIAKQHVDSGLGNFPQHVRYMESLGLRDVSVAAGFEKKL